MSRSNPTAADSVAATRSTATNNTELSNGAMQSSPKDATALQLGIMILVLGSSAGMVFYTKRTGSMLQTLNKISESQMSINKVKHHGPITMKEADKLKPRIDKDEFF